MTLFPLLVCVCLFVHVHHVTITSGFLGNNDNTLGRKKTCRAGGHCGTQCHPLHGHTHIVAMVETLHI